MSITGVLRAAMMQLRVLDLEKSVDFYTRVVGLFEVGRTSDGRVLLKGYDEFDHHSFILRQAPEAGMDFMGFKVASDAYLDVLAANTQQFGLNVEQIPANSDQPGIGRRVSTMLPTGHRVDFFAESELSEPHPGLLNPEIWTVEPKGIGATVFDHALLFGPNASESVRFFTEVCGMATVEKATLPDGGTLCTWLTCANRTHDVAVLEFDKPGKLHHVGYKLESWNDIGHAADIMTMNDVNIDAGPMRHGVTRGQTIYFFDPSGNRLETYAGGYAHYPDMPVRVWDFDHIGKGIFYYTRQLNENFLNVVS